MKINWSAREVDVFLSLAETLSFRRPALQVHLSQSAVSRQILLLCQNYREPFESQKKIAIGA